MAEVDETHEEETPFVAPDTVETPEPDEEGEEAEESEPTEQPEEAPEQPEQPQGLTEKQLEQRFTKLEKENEKHAAAVGRILEEDANDLTPCPWCSDFIQGFILNAQPTDEKRAQIIAAIGLVDTSDLPELDYLEACPTCQGRGEGKTHSRRIGYETENCKACEGTGYRQRGDMNGMNTSMARDYIAPHDDAAPPPPAQLAEVERLQALGYTVVPPFTVPAS